MSETDKMADPIIESNKRKLAFAKAHPNDLSSEAGILVPLKSLIPRFEATIKHWEQYKRKRARELKQIETFMHGVKA